MISQVLLVAAVATVALSFQPAYVHHAQPYKFGYSVKDKHGEQHREEVGDGGNAVKGSYGFTDDRGVHRQVNYVADKAGFRAQVKTNEPGTANQNPAAVEMISNAPYGGGYAGGLVGGLGYGAAPGIVGGLGYAAAPGIVGGLGYGGAGLGYGGLGYAGIPNGLGYGGLGLGILGGLGYARYGY